MFITLEKVDRYIIRTFEALLKILNPIDEVRNLDRIYALGSDSALLATSVSILLFTQSYKEARLLSDAIMGWFLNLTSLMFVEVFSLNRII